MKENRELQQRIRKIEKEIDKIKERLCEIGPMRPGTLTKQYKDRKTKSGPSYQLSYTHQMKSRTDYVRAALVPTIRKEVGEYKKFKALTERWVELAIELSKLKVLQLKTTGL